MTQVSPVILLNPLDNVAVARVQVAAGTVLEEFGITALEAVPQGHKIALTGIAAGEPVRKPAPLIRGLESLPLRVTRH